MPISWCDGRATAFAYGWALSRPVRKLFYNLTVTTLSVVIALGIGTVELLSVAAERPGLAAGPWPPPAGRRGPAGGPGAGGSRIDLNLMGYVVVGLFAATWALAALAWR